MTPSQQQAKDMQDEARRDQQADERIRELEEEVEQLRRQRDRYDYVLHGIRGRLSQIIRDDPSHFSEIHAAIAEVDEALDGGGGDNA